MTIGSVWYSTLGSYRIWFAMFAAAFRATIAMIFKLNVSRIFLQIMTVATMHSIRTMNAMMIVARDCPHMKSRAQSIDSSVMLKISYFIIL